jgi:hypothetical protein
VVEQVERVRAEVDEQPAAADLRLHPPGQVVGLPHAWHALGAHADRPRPADGAVVEELLDRDEPRHGAAVVRDEERHAGGGARGNHLLGLGGGARDGLLDVDRLARRRGAQHVVVVAVRRRRDVDRVHLRVRDEGVGVVVPARHPVAARVVGGLLAVAAHDRDELGAVGALQAGPALALGDVADADDAPADGVEHGG